MNRALPLLLIAALAAGGLGYFALQSGSEPISTDNDLPAPTTNVPTGGGPSVAKPVTLAVPAQGAQRPKAKDTSGICKSFEVIPMNSLGQLIKDASVVAVQGDEQLTGTGRMKWTDLPAGEWTLTIEAKDAPKWERTLILAKGERRKEAAYVCDELRIKGEVLDAYGVASAKTQLFFLPPGVGHPTRAQLATGKNRKGPKGKWETTSGAIAATTGTSGTFSVRLPKPGKWRISVGYPDKPFWTQSKPSELTVGGPDNVRIVIPSKSRLTMTLNDLENRPSQVSAYTYDAEFAARMQRQNQEREAMSGKSANVQQEQKRLNEEVRRLKAQGGSDVEASGGKNEGGGERQSRESRKRAMEENAREARERRGGGRDYRGAVRSPLFEPGWRPVGTARFDEAGVAVLNNLPGNENLRFLFVRGRERITTRNTSRLKPSVRSLATVDLPQPLPDSEEAPRSDAGSVRVELDQNSESAKLEETVEWFGL